MKHIIVIHGERHNGKSSAAAHLAASHAMAVCQRKGLDPWVTPHLAVWLDLKQEWAEDRLKRMHDLGIAAAAIELIRPLGAMALDVQPIGIYDLVVCDNWDRWPISARNMLMAKWNELLDTREHRLLVLVRETP